MSDKHAIIGCNCNTGDMYYNKIETNPDLNPQTQDNIALSYIQFAFASRQV